MAFELAEIDPTSVPINLLNPRPGTKFGDRDYMDPWEAVKWIAIFRLILPDALFRLCGGRVENLGELQPLAVKAGLNGVMMGNFLTTLGTTPDEDRAMFTDLGLNVARQPDNGVNPRPDNRSGWLDGETPDVVEAFLDTPAEAEAAGIEIRLWDPATQLRFSARPRKPPPRPDGAPNTLAAAGCVTSLPIGLGREPDDRHRGPPGRAPGARALPPHADGQRAAGAARRARRQAGAAAVLEQLPRARRPSRACARPRPTRRCAGASARGRRGSCRAR